MESGRACCRCRRLLLAAALPSAPRAVPLTATRKEEFLWRTGLLVLRSLRGQRSGRIARNVAIRAQGDADSAAIGGGGRPGPDQRARHDRRTAAPVRAEDRARSARARAGAGGGRAMLPLRGAAQSQCPDRASKRDRIDEAPLSGGASRQSHQAHDRAGLRSIRYFGAQAVEASGRLDDLPDRSDPHDRAAWPDECLARPGYAQFIDALRSAVAKRDAARLRSLFAADGRMRLNGIGGGRNFPGLGISTAPEPLQSGQRSKKFSGSDVHHAAIDLLCHSWRRVRKAPMTMC